MGVESQVFNFYSLMFITEYDRDGWAAWTWQLLKWLDMFILHRLKELATVQSSTLHVC